VPWPRSTLAVAALIIVVAFSGGGCGFQPLYGSGTTTASGTRLAEAMSAVEVKPIPGRVGQKIRNELIFSNTGGGPAPEPRYKLQVVIRESVIDQLVQITGDARGQVLVLDATFKLVDLANNQVLFQSVAVSRAPYNRYQEIFANVRARYDGENRAAREIAGSIKTQVAAFLAKSA